MICQKCNTNQGVPYTFYYGRMVDKKSETISQTANDEVFRITEYFTLGGQESVVLCSKCLRGGCVFWLLVVGLFFIGLLLSFGLSSVLYFLLISILAPVVISIAEYNSDSKTKGVQKAIEFRKTALMQQGFDTFWTPQQYANLRKNIN